MLFNVYVCHTYLILKALRLIFARFLIFSSFVFQMLYSWYDMWFEVDWDHTLGMSDPLSPRPPRKGKIVNIRIKFLDDTVHVFQVPVSFDLRILGH